MRAQVCQGCGTELPPPVSTQDHRRKWCSDRCRKRQYAGTCVDCGARTNGYNGPGTAADRCVQCAGAHNRVWTRDAIVAAIRRYEEEFGEPPGVRIFDTDAAYPSTTTVRNQFGSWNAGLRAAGCEPTREFNRPYEHDPSVLGRAAAMYAEGRTLDEVGVAFGVSGRRVAQWLDKLGIPRRGRLESRRLREVRERVAA